MNKVEELSLLIYVAIINGKKLPEVMNKWSGCEPEVYTEQVQINLCQTALSDISKEYHIPSLLYHYFEAQRISKFLQDSSELTSLESVFRWIPVKIWSDEDKERLKAIKKEYIDEVLEDVQ